MCVFTYLSYMAGKVYVLYRFKPDLFRFWYFEHKIEVFF